MYICVIHTDVYTYIYIYIYMYISGRPATAVDSCYYDYDADYDTCVTRLIITLVVCWYCKCYILGIVYIVNIYIYIYIYCKCYILRRRRPYDICNLVPTNKRWILLCY